MVDIFDWIYVIGVCGALVYIVIKKCVTYFRYERYHRTRGQDLVDEVFMSEREWQNRKRVEQTEPKRLLGYVSCEQTDYVRFDPENLSWFEPSETTPDWWLIVGINVAPHPRLRRDGTSIYLDQTVSFYQAAMGAEVEIPSLDGKVKCTVAAGTQPGTTLRLRGKGVPVLNGRGRGDQFVTIRVEVPRSMNEAQKEALKKFAETMGENAFAASVEGESGGIFKRKKKK